MNWTYVIGGTIGTLWMLVVILVKQSESKGKTLEQLQQAEDTVDALKNQATIANRADVDRDELYARLRGRSDRFVPTIPRDE